MSEPPVVPSGRTRTAVLISGRGSNLQALIEACARPGAAAEIALVVANRADAPGLERARACRIPPRSSIIVDFRPETTSIEV